MKQTKWQRLATIGLCSSLVINAFSGVTAVAETITIESSPTVASSAKEATSASSATQASTESSQETTETSREEVTQETEKQAEIPEVKTETTESVPENSSENDLQKSISPRWVSDNQVIYPRMTFAFTDETGKAFADENLTLSGTYYKLARHAATSQWRPYATRYPIVSSNAGGGQYRVAVNAAVPMPYDFLTNLPAGYAVNMYAIEQLKIDNTLKYVDSIVAPVGTIRRTYYSDQQVSETPQFGNYGSANLTQRDRTFSKNSANIFSLNSVALAPSINDVLTMMSTDGTVSALGRDIILVGFDGTLTYHQTMNYKVTRKQVTEKFVDANGVAVTPPTGFTQNKKTPMTSNAFTFKQAGTLPDTYQADGKTYKFKGWYKGKTKPNTLTTTKAPSYAVTYDDNDDLNVVYEEVVPRDTWVYPGFYAEFVDEQGKAFTNPLTFSGNYTQFLRKKTVNIFETTGNLYPMIGSKDPSQSNKYKIETQSRIPISATYDGNVTGDVYDKREYGLHDLTITNELKYVDKIEVMNTSLQAADYLVGYVGIDPILIDFPNILHPLERAFIKNTNQRFSINAIFGANGSASTIPRLLRIGGKDQPNQRNVTLMGFDGTTNYKHTMNYKVTRKQVTENFVDTNGTKITPPTGFTQGNQIPMTSNTFKYTAAKALPASYTTGGKTYIFQGWYKGKTKPNTLTTSTTPTYNTTFDGNDDMTAMYKEEVPKASVALTRTTAETVTSGGNVTWRATITNTSQAPLTTATIKKSTAWTTGLAAPTAVIVTPAGGTAKTVPVTATTWTNGVSLGTDIPVGKSATVQFTTKATGTAGQVLRAGITTSGNYSGVSTSATVRVKDNDQAIVTPTAEGFISVPTFNFGQVDVASATKQHGLKKAADYYGNGTRNPYLRIKKTQPNWSLTAQLSQPKSATDSLPTATRLLLGAAPVSSFSNYNQPTELKNAVGTTSAISLNANNTATRIIANQQFTGSNIYQLDFTFNNVKLEVPANQGVKGQQYQVAVTWNLVTGP
ncbi:WxL domain-containing protein [Enterococcus faecalis]|uniref:WxL domain-containing protein n=1 Tax=Enterococcus faecalis TaxID=1351 RepID=UPI001AD7E247|nr:WxL domain-containing protein [Enterococcus faecalis]MBO6323104.1 WxL domain-containing protein [Enterococcus faecalis]